MQQSIVNKKITTFNCQNDLLYISRRRLRKGYWTGLMKRMSAEWQTRPGNSSVRLCRKAFRQSLWKATLNTSNLLTWIAIPLSTRVLSTNMKMMSRREKKEAWIVGVTMQVSCQNQGRGFEATDQCAYVRCSKTGFQISVKILWKFCTF